MEDNHNRKLHQWNNLNDFTGRQPHRRMPTQKEDDITERQHHRKTKTSLQEGDLPVKWPHRKMTSHWIKPQRKTIRQEDSNTGDRPKRKMILVCLVSQICTELGSAQPQFVIFEFPMTFKASKTTGNFWLPEARVGKFLLKWLQSDQAPKNQSLL